MSRFARELVTTGIIAILLTSIGLTVVRFAVVHNYAIEVSPTIETTEFSSRELVMRDALACEWDDNGLIFFSGNVFSPLIYYSHLFPVFAMCALAALVWLQGKDKLLRRLFLFIAFAFTGWCLSDLATWAEANPDIELIFWSLLIYFDPLIYMATAYLFYVFAYQRDIPLSTKIQAIAAFMPILLFAPTSHNITAFDYTNCDREAVEGMLWYYVYLLEILTILWTTIHAVRALRSPALNSRGREVFLFAAGLIFFMLAFSWGNLVGTLTDNWVVAQYGLFGMPLFLAVVMYLIIQHQAFEVKTIATTGLVATIGLMLGSILLLPDMDTARPIIAITLLFFSGMGYLLVQSVRKEVRLRETVQEQEKSLEVANAQQVNLLHFISHEIKGSLNKAQGVFAGMLEGDYGTLPESLRTITANGLREVQGGISMVMDILDASNLKKGTVSFAKKRIDLRETVGHIVDMARATATEKDLHLEYAAPSTGALVCECDEEKLSKHVFRNLIENAIHYTPQGFVRITLSKHETRVRFSVEDSGVGITPEDMAHLFTEGGKGKESTKVNVNSTGYGLFIAKQVVEAHGGSIRAESDGAGKGSRFVVELPLA